VGSGNSGCQPHGPALITCTGNDCSLHFRVPGLREPTRPSRVLVDPSVPRPSLGSSRVRSPSVVTCPVHIMNAPSEGAGGLRSNTSHKIRRTYF
jgi:hypothetical protein